MRGYRELFAHPQLRLIFIVGFLIRLPVSGAGVLLTLHVVTHLHRNYADAGLLAAIYTVASGIAGPYRGRMLDRVGLRRTMLPSLLILPVLWAVAPFIGYWWLAVLLVVAGWLLIPTFSIVRQAVVAIAPPDLRRTALSADSVCVEFAFMLGPALAVILAGSWGTPAAMLLFYVGGNLLCWVLFALNPTLRGTEDEHATHGHWITPRVGIVLALMASAVLVLAATDVTIVASLRGLGRASSLPWVLVLWSLGSAVGGVAYGAYKRAIHPAIFLFGMSAMTAPLAVMSHSWGIALFLAVSGLCCAPLIASTVDYLSRLVATSRFGEAMGWHQSIGTIGGAIGSPVAGVVIDSWGWRAAFLSAGVVGALAALACALAWVVLRRRDQTNTTAAAV